MIDLIIGSRSYAEKPNGMSEEKEAYLRERGNLFQEPDSTLLLSVSYQSIIQLIKTITVWLWSPLARCSRHFSQQGRECFRVGKRGGPLASDQYGKG